MKVAISGAGIAGPALAYWLMRTGHEPTIIERAPTFRVGGYIIDFWGVGYDIAERMGLMPAIRARGYQVEEVRIESESGKTASSMPVEVFQRLTNNRFTSLLRGDLAQVIFDSVRGNVETIFGDSIAAVENTDHGVGVTLESGARRDFDLLVAPTACTQTCAG